MTFTLIDYTSGKSNDIEAVNLTAAELIALNSQDLFTWSIFKETIIMIVYKDVIVSEIWYFDEDPIRRKDNFIKMNNVIEIL